MTKPFFIALVISMTVPLIVSAQGFVPLAEIPGLTQGVTANTEGLANFFNNLYKFAIGMASVLAVIMIIWGGLQYATQDIPGAKNEGKERILQAILGLVLVLSPALVFSLINPSILNLSVNLPPLDTKSGGAAPAPAPAPRPQTKTALPAKAQDVYDTAQKGKWCYGRTDPKKADSSLEYICSPSQTVCESDQRTQGQQDGVQFVTVCKQY